MAEEHTNRQVLIFDAFSKARQLVEDAGLTKNEAFVMCLSLMWACYHDAAAEDCWYQLASTYEVTEKMVEVIHRRY